MMDVIIVLRIGRDINMQNGQGKLAIVKQLYSITVDNSDKMFKELKSAKQPQQNHQLHETIQKMREQISKLSLSLQKQSQLTFILKSYYGKIEKVIYNRQSHLFNQTPIDYEKLQLHMREILRRLADVHNEKLNSVPVVYRKNNIKIYKQTVDRKMNQE